MTTSPCTSPKHPEYSCLIKWSVSGKKFGVNKWCKGCLKYYEGINMVRMHNEKI